MATTAKTQIAAERNQWAALFSFAFSMNFRGIIEKLPDRKWEKNANKCIAHQTWLHRRDELAWRYNSDGDDDDDDCIVLCHFFLFLSFRAISFIHLPFRSLHDVVSLGACFFFFFVDVIRIGGNRKYIFRIDIARVRTTHETKKKWKLK